MKEAAAVLVVLVLGTALLCGTTLDLDISGLFHDADAGFHLEFKQPWVSLYYFTEVAAITVALCFVPILIVTLWKDSWRIHRRPAAFIVLLMLLGPGLLVNGLLKPYWGRPRPRAVVDFGGRYEYRPVWSPDFGAPGASFPSGHAAAGFFAMAPYFMLRRSRQKRAARVWLVGGLAFGLITGLCRIVQGGHFASDVLWSAGIVCLLSLALDAWLPPTPGQYLIPEPR